MDSVAPALLILAPFLAALFCSVFSWLERRLCFPTAVLGLLVSLVAALELVLRVRQAGVVQYTMGGWSPPFGIEYRIDALSVLVILIIACIALLNLVASHQAGFGTCRIVSAPFTPSPSCL